MLSNKIVLEPLEVRRLLSSGVVTSGPGGMFATASTALTADIVAPRRVFVIGNSMTDGLNYAGFPQLLAREGGSVSFGRQTGSGYTIAQNYDLDPTTIGTSGVDPARPSTTNPWGNYSTAFNYGWDALTVQPADQRLLDDVPAIPIGTPAGQNIANVPMTQAFLEAFAPSNSAGQMFVYSRTTRRTDVNQDMSPTGLSFDYSTEWRRDYVDTGASANLAFFSRSYVQQLMPLVRGAQDANPTTAAMQNVRLIPVGEAYYNIDQALKSGKFAGTGVSSIKDFYLDQSHPSSDLGAYVIALSFYSSITGIDPRGVAPTAAYLSTTRIKNATVQQVLQDAVYDAITSTHYAGWTTPLTTAPPPPPPPTTGTIEVRTFSDLNRDGAQQSGENGIGGLTVYLDVDNDGVKDSGERSTVTASDGIAVFSNVAIGTYKPRVTAPPIGYSATTQPTSLTIIAGSTISRVLGFYKAPSTVPAGTSTITGAVVNDSNHDGKWSTGEKAVAGRTVWIDLDNDGTKDSNEPSAVTNTSGRYTFSKLAAGTYRIRQVVPTGWVATLPVKNLSLSATVATGATRANVNFFAYASK